MSSHRLDVTSLYQMLDDRRRNYDLSWRGVGRETGLGSSTFTRISHGHAPDADALVSLIVWLDLDAGLAGLIEPRATP